MHQSILSSIACDLTMASSRNNRTNLPFSSLADLLSASKSTSSSLTTRSNANVSTAAHLPSLEELKKKLDSNQLTSSKSKLNFSRAFQGFSDSSARFDFNAKPSPSNLLAAESASTLLNHNNKAIRIPRNDLFGQRRELRSNFRNSRIIETKEQLRTDSTPHQKARLDSKESIKNLNLSLPAIKEEIDSEVTDQSHREILHLIRKIEKQDVYNAFNSNESDENQFDGFEDNKCDQNNLADFDLIQLPNDFKLEHGQVNIYQSGIIEFISGDTPSMVYRVKRALKNKNKILKTDLILATDSEAFITQTNVCLPSH